ncbi:assimilatory nitrate reductase catalytic subunit [Novimethylophilus kurashikiensis]|uniref:nitrate reductase (cytochrome) n=1 Tax=Novimethylophilus kurashikiensis TaxID=1825523 RepID=A0A2R5FCB9_9PROT|nr:nitrate reductase [Novimethylophilus kurashikiensis]GBG15862.1 assimilatory nitrate reductase catalytic subunit [Novimethylophilus kurashikiensis]
MQETKSTCCYCGVGCGVIIESEGDRIVGVRGDPDHPANFGRLCTKGSTLHLTARHDLRALYPEMRLEKHEPRQRVSWDDALDHAVQHFAQTIREHGPDSVGFYISGQLLTEDYYVFNKLAKGLIGTNNIDTNSRLCMSSAVAGYKATLGADAPPACYEDIDHAQCLFIAGSNTAYAHPIVFRRIEDARKNNPDLKLIVVDPRRTDTAQSADLFLPIQPGTDVALFNGMLHVMLWEGLVDMDYVRAHTEGFDALKETVREYTPKLVADICGVPEADIVTAARWFGTGPTLSMYCQGLNQSSSGTDKNAALINLHLATGQIGKPGAGPFSLTGQPNAMGGREVGGMANLLSAHRNLADPQHRAEIATFWGVEQVPDKPGKSAVEMFDAVKNGEIKALWIACTNPAQSMPDLGSVHEALANVPFLVVQDAYRNIDTARYADVLLPATTWGEKEGTVTNSERRITHVVPAVAAPGETRPDWQIMVDFARRLGFMLEKGYEALQLFPYEAPEAIFNEHRETTRGRDLDITGLSYAMLDSQGPQQWPLPEGAMQGQARLYADGVFPQPGGKAKFVSAKYRAVAEKTDARFPFHLTTGRMRDQWHGMSRTGTVPQLFNHVEEPMLAMNADDMARRQLQNGDLVKVSSRRGNLMLRVKESDEVMPAQAYIPMHWGGQFMNGAGVNALTLSNFDPVSKQPELKHAAIKVEKAELPWRLIVMRRGRDTLKLMEALQPMLARFEYANCGLYGRDDGMVVLRAAGATAASQALIDELDALLELTEDVPCLTYRDPKRGISKRVVVENGKVTGVRLVGETLAADWLKEVMTQDGFPEDVRLWALAPVNAPPSGKQGRGRIVCSCMDVSENEIKALITEGADLSQLQSRLKCGTQCGSCVPELKKMLG